MLTLSRGGFGYRDASQWAYIRAIQALDVPLVGVGADMLQRRAGLVLEDERAGQERGFRQAQNAVVGSEKRAVTTPICHAFVTVLDPSLPPPTMASSFFTAKAPSNKTTQKQTVEPALQPWVEK